MIEKDAKSRPVIRDVYPYLCARDAAAALDFYHRIFGAEEVLRLTESNGRIAHAELRLGPCLVMLADEHPEYGILSRGTLSPILTCGLELVDATAGHQRQKEVPVPNDVRPHVRPLLDNVIVEGPVRAHRARERKRTELELRWAR